MKPLVQIKNLSAGYEGQEVLHDINLTIYERDFLGIIGPNGGGKTTLVRCLLGLITPHQGAVIHAEKELRMGYLPQLNRIDHRFPITVEEVVLSGFSPSGKLTARYNAAERQRAKEVIEQMGLTSSASHPIHRLSGGELQRSLLGRAIVSSPQLLILDEPSTYLDHRFQSRLYQLLDDINRSCAIVLVSHDVGTVLRQVRSIACVNGTLHYHPAPGEVNPVWLEENFNCPIELLAHGHFPHRVVGEHQNPAGKAKS